jgi:hypothetical protein
MSSKVYTEMYGCIYWYTFVYVYSWITLLHDQYCLRLISNVICVFVNCPTQDSYITLNSWAVK